MRKLVDMDVILGSEELTQHFVHDRINRQAAHGQLRCPWSQVEQITGKDMEYFRLPHGANLRPCAANEVRVRTYDGYVFSVDRAAGKKGAGDSSWLFASRLACTCTDH